LSTSWQKVHDLTLDAFELNDDPKRDVYWYESIGQIDEPESARAHRLAPSRQEPIATLVSGEYWARNATRDLSFNRAWIGSATRTILLEAGLESPWEAFLKSIDELYDLGIPRAFITELIASACLPPKGTNVRWLTLGECLHRLLDLDLAIVACHPVTTLEIDSSNVRLLRRNGIQSVARLLFSYPGQLITLRAFGQKRFSNIVSSLVLQDHSEIRARSKLSYRPVSRVPFSAWLNLRGKKLTESFVDAVSEILIQGSASPASTSHQMQNAGLLQLNEAELISLGVDPRALLRAMSLLSDELSYQNQP
jgi:hypothetical protein